MLQSLHLTNITLFQQAELRFSQGLNVFVGENGSGKTHLLKLAYVMAACLQDPLPTRGAMQSLLADKLVSVLRPEALGRLVRRRAGREGLWWKLDGSRAMSPCDTALPRVY